jgi:hypothetical protein
MSLPKTDFDDIELWAFYGLTLHDTWDRFLLLPFKRKRDYIEAAYFSKKFALTNETISESDWANYDEGSYAKKGYYAWSEKAHEAIKSIFSSDMEFGAPF